MDRSWFPMPLALVAILAGVAFQAFMSLMPPGPPDAFAVAIFVWGCVPHALCLAIARWGHPNYGFFTAVACILGNVLIYYSVFVVPQSSTAAIGLLFFPLVNIFFFIPIGAFLGYLNRRAAEKLPAP